METDEAIVRARIAALKKLLQVRERQTSSLMHKNGYSHKRQPHFTPYGRPQASSMSAGRTRPTACNLSWRAEPATQEPYHIGERSTVMQERPSDPSKMLSLEDGKYRKTGRGFSLRREDAMPKSAIEVSALIAEKKAINATTMPEQTVPPPARQAPTPPATPLPMYMSTNNPPGVVRREYCLFYNKYGECKKKNACLFVHDSRKIAICRGFLRGTCTDKECKLSHQLDPTKMPDCAPFLRGLCTREGCMYRHVNVSRDADVCDGFAKGYCALGLQCPLKHEFARANRSSNVKPMKASNETAKETRLNDVPADEGTSTVVVPPALNIRPTIRFTPKVV